MFLFLFRGSETTSNKYIISLGLRSAQHLLEIDERVKNTFMTVARMFSILLYC